MTRVNNINKYSVIPDLLLPENVAYQQFLGTEMLIILKQLFSHIKHLIYF